ncbi:hypothetical protein SAMN04487785_115133 [Dyella jiangningensis]|nr:hypothetical protein BDW41_10515 [Dyella sp. AtDHG13]SDL17569.1 hypothetical protein SAMN04487785_115133 [Dyella jiangningensis]
MGKLTRWGAALVLAMGTGQAMASSAPATEDQVRQLMEVVGLGKMLLQMNTQAVNTLQQSMPCVPADFWQNYMNESQTQLYIGRLVPVWQRHFSSDEMNGLLKFYRSPLGQKVINEMPTTMAEANEAGQQWSHERSDQMINELKHMGTLDSSGRCPAKVAASPAPAAAVAGGAAVAAGAEAGSDEEEAKPVTHSTHATSHATSHTKAPAKKASTPAKPAAKKAAPAKSSAKAPAKTNTKAAPAKKDTKPATTTGGQGGQ